MGRLADLLTERGTTAEQAAIAVGVAPLFIQRVDQGRQPMPADVARLLARFLSVELWEIRAACPLNTELEGPALRRAIPPSLGEPVAPTVIVATQPVQGFGAPPGPPLDSRTLTVFFDGNFSDAGEHILEDWRIQSNGAMTTLINFKRNNEDEILAATSGLYIPPDSSTTIAALDQIDGLLVKLESFGLNDSLSYAGGLTGAQELVWDSLNEFLWFVDGATGDASRVDGSFNIAASVPMGTTPRAICFADLSMFVLTQDVGVDTDWFVVRVRPTPGLEGIVVTSSAWTSVGSTMNASSICAPGAAEPDTLYTPGDPGDIIRWTVVGGDTPSITPTFVELSPGSSGVPEDLIHSLVYDVEADRFWGLTETSIFRCNRSGVCDFLDVVNPSNPTASLLLIIPELDLVVAPGSLGGSNAVLAYRRSIPTLLTSTAVGGGPNPMGQNFPPLSFALKP